MMKHLRFYEYLKEKKDAENKAYFDKTKWCNIIEKELE